jgi:hypothetical protein
VAGGYYLYQNGDRLLNGVAPTTRALLQLIA